MRILQRLLLGLLVAVAAAACSTLQRPDPWCPPVDPGGDCFLPSDQAFVAHALESSTAWPQLRGVPLTAGPVIQGFDEAARQQTWIVPLWSDGKVVAASRFLPYEGHARLSEIAVYLPPRDDFPIPRPGERLVLSEITCSDPWPDACLFQNYTWEIK